MIPYQIKPNDTQMLNRVIQHLAEMNPEKTWIVTIEEVKKKRSLPQNSLYWEWCTIIGKDLGYTKDEMHEAFAGKFLGMQERKTIFGDTVKEPVSTASQPKDKFTEYMNKVEAFALMNEIRLPKPDYWGYDER